jgi:hypothetical protein
VKKCVAESLEKKYDDTEGSSIQFTPPIPQHNALREQMKATNQVRTTGLCCMQGCWPPGDESPHTHE